jgi:hypothetical protein
MENPDKNNFVKEISKKINYCGEKPSELLLSRVRVTK